MHRSVVRLSKVFSLSVLFVAAFVGVPSVFAADTPVAVSTPSGPPDFAKNIKSQADFEALTSDQKQALQDFMTSKSSGHNAMTVATVNVRNAALLGQNGNVFTLAFDISNRDGIQPKVVYAVDLNMKNAAGTTVLVDRKVYDNDILALGTNDSIRKEIVYEAPASLKGEYTIAIEARNPDGLTFGIAPIMKPVVLEGSGARIDIDSDACFLTVDGEAGGKRYAPSQGVDIAAEESLTAHCTLTNRSETTLSAVPTIETRYRTVFGKRVGAETTLDPVTIAPGSTSDLVFALPKASEPQAYDVVLTLANEKQGSLSSPVVFHYVLRGESATIQNLTLDKDRYSKGEIANLSLFWSGSADNFPDSRSVGTEIPAVSATLSIVGDQGISCVEPFVRNLDARSAGGMEKLSISVTNDCVNPVVSLRIADGNGKILASNEYAVRSKDDSAPTSASPLTGKSSPLSVYGVIVLLIVLLGIGMWRKNRRSGLAIVFGLMMGFGILTSGGEAKADTFWVGGTVYWVSTDAYNYAPGQIMYVSGGWQHYWCANLGAYQNLYATTNGQGAYMFNGWFGGPVGGALSTVAFQVPYAQGGQQVALYGYLSFCGHGGCEQYANSMAMNYNVVNNPPYAPDWYGPGSVPVNSWTNYSFHGWDPDGSSMAYYIDWGDGQRGWLTGWVPNGTWTNGAHAWANPGSYLVTMYAYDQFGAWSPPSQRWIYVYNNPPYTPDWYGPGAVPANNWVNYSFHAWDPDGSSMAYYIDWGDGQRGWLTGWVPNGTWTNGAHAWANPGSYLVTMYAYDQFGAWSPPSQRWIYAYNSAPNAPAFWGPSSTDINVNTGYGFYGSDPNGDSLAYYVDWGDGQAGWITGWVPSGSYAFPSHTWATAGYKLIAAYAYDQYGTWSPPAYYGVNVIGPIDGQCGATNNSCISGTLSDIPDIPNASYRWNCNGRNGGSNVSCSACMTSFWSPDTSSVCAGSSFVQTSNCGETRAATGTGTGIWSPDASETCSFSTVLQERCGNQRIVNGTKRCSTSGWHEVAPVQ